MKWVLVILILLSVFCIGLNIVSGAYWIIPMNIVGAVFCSYTLRDMYLKGR